MLRHWNHWHYGVSSCCSIWHDISMDSGGLWIGHQIPALGLFEDVIKQMFSSALISEQHWVVWIERSYIYNRNPSVLALIRQQKSRKVQSKAWKSPSQDNLEAKQTLEHKDKPSLFTEIILTIEAWKWCVFWHLSPFIQRDKLILLTFRLTIICKKKKKKGSWMKNHLFLGQISIISV